ncbi:hypothetical protein CA13_51770 [Planctomycetes bacterium CA13]|uniref:Uncharacterized protein n=1 Tax=Novipirellula herctigrandis TaxID=2527986 RepID=A0A5C5Z933_9BACT|nr:hypothetical protein CA13_51770 [Planctomycetes bacterium CA13]
MKQRIQSQPRSGAAFLLLVILVLLVVVAAVRTMVKAEVSSRRGGTERQRVRMMIAAIDAAKPIFDENVDGSVVELELPVTPSERIIVNVSDDKTKRTAVWFRGDKKLDFVTLDSETRAIQTNETTEEDEE